MHCNLRRLCYVAAAFVLLLTSLALNSPAAPAEPAEAAAAVPSSVAGPRAVAIDALQSAERSVLVASRVNLRPSEPAADDSLPPQASNLISVATSTSYGLSPPLDSLAMVSLAAPSAPAVKLQQAEQPAAADAPTMASVEQTQHGTKPAPQIVASFDGLGVGFEGPQGRGGGGNPSDNSIAVGPDHIVVTVNSRMAIFTKKGAKYDETGRVLYGPVNHSNVFRDCGNCERNNGDTVVRYDQLADRWLIVMPLFSRSPRREVEPPAAVTGGPALASMIGRDGQPGPALELYQPTAEEANRGGRGRGRRGAAAEGPGAAGGETPAGGAGERRGGGGGVSPPIEEEEFEEAQEQETQPGAGRGETPAGGEARGGATRGARGRRGGRGQGNQGSYGMCYAISVGPDPMGPYYRYEFVRPLFPDYPRPAVWPDGYYVPTSTSDNVIQKHACVVERSKMLKGEPATEQCFTIDGVNFLNNADLDGKQLPPAGAPNIMMAAGGAQLNRILKDDAIYAWKFFVNWDEPAKTRLEGPEKIAVAPYEYLCGGQLTRCVPQPGSENRLDAQGDKIMARLVYRRIGDQESIVGVHSVNTTAGGGGVRWYEFRLEGDRNPKLYQQGTYAPEGHYRWMASPAIDKFGNIGIGYSFGSAEHYTGQRFAGRQPNDPLGVLTLREAVLIEGQAAQERGNRWQDYTQTAVDPSDDCTIWYVGDYLKEGSTSYSSRVGAFRMPGCGSAAN